MEAWPLDIPAERQRAHILLDRLAPAKLGAICSLLEVIVDDDELTEADRTAIQAGLDSLKTNGGVPMEDVLADFGLTVADFEQMADTPRHRDVESEDWQLGEIRSAITELDAGWAVDHESVSKWLKSWGKAGETQALR